MKFAHNEDLALLVEGTRAVLEAENSAARLRDETQSGLELWPQLAELGLLGVAMESGLRLAEVTALMEEAGRVALPEPLSDTAAVVVPALATLGEADRAAAVCRGDLRVAIAHPLNPHSNFAQGADALLVFEEQAVSWCEAFAATPEPGIDPWRRLATVTPGEQQQMLTGAQAARLTRWAAASGAVAAAAELCGLADTMIRMATEYAGTREQFGQPIGSFQAVKHLLANARIKLEFARPVVHRAGFALEEDGPARELAVAHAKLAATDAAIFAAEQAIQVFGGMGYTYEADLHFFMKRAWALAGCWGDREHHLTVLERAVVEGGVEVGPAASFFENTDFANTDFKRS